MYIYVYVYTNVIMNKWLEMGMDEGWKIGEIILISICLIKSSHTYERGHLHASA